MAGRECYHCKQWIGEGAAHDCWTTTEAALTRDLPDDIREAWERLRETAASFGEQRIYAAHHSIMFSRKACYAFVRPKMTGLEICIFLGRALKSARVRRSMPASRSKIANIVLVRHRDEIEAPLTDWLLEAYESSEQLSGPAKALPAERTEAAARSRTKRRDQPAKARARADRNGPRAAGGAGRKKR